MCLQRCLNTLCCANDKWQVLLYTSILGIALTMVDIYSDIFVVIDFLYQKEHYWALTLILIIISSNSFITREVIMVMKPESFCTVICVSILCMLGFGPVVLLCYLFFDVDDDNKKFFSDNKASQIQSLESIPPNAHPFYQTLVTIQTNMTKIRVIESFSQSMLSAALQITYLILLDDQNISYHDNWMLMISVTLSLLSFGSGVAKWIANYATLAAFHNKSFFSTNWYYIIFGTLYFVSDLAMRLISFTLFYIFCTDNDQHVIWHICIGAIAFWEVVCCRIATKMWNMNQAYTLDDVLMDSGSFLGGILYCVMGAFSSYYYMSQLPLNCVCGFIMLVRYMVNSTAFIVYFMSINYSLSESCWAVVYLALYALNLITFVIWLVFKHRRLSQLIIQKQDVQEPLLKDQSMMSNENAHVSTQSRQSVSASGSVAIQMQTYNNNMNMPGMNAQIRMIGGYNPPTPSPHQLQLFHDYQCAIQLQQKQLMESAQKQTNPNQAMRDMKHQPLLLHQQYLMQRQYNQMNIHNSELALKLETRSNRSHSDDAFEVLSEGVPLPKHSADDTEQMYGIDAEDNKSLSKSRSSMMEGGGRNQQMSRASVCDSFDVSFGYNPMDKGNKVTIVNKALVAVMVQSTTQNDGNWYNIFGRMSTRNEVQYHWKVRVKQLNTNGDVRIGLVDAGSVNTYQNTNRKEKNKQVFDGFVNGFGVAKDGHLHTRGKDVGEYCQKMKQGDVIDVYFDTKQYSLWFGINGKDFGVAYKINAKGCYRLATAMHGANHALEIVGYDAVRY